MPRRLTRKGGSCCGRSGRRPSMRRSGPAVGGKKRKTARRPRRKATKKYGKKRGKKDSKRRRTRHHKRRHYRGGEGGDELSRTDIEMELNRAHIPDDKRAELRPQLKALRLPVPDNYVSQYYTSYATRVAAANKSYDLAIERIDSEVETARKDAENNNEDFTDADKEEWEEFFKEMAEKRKRLELRSAETYKNDLANYAYALLEDWSKDGGNLDHPLV